MQFGQLSLDRFQVEAITALKSGDVLVVAPTGTGKTLVADWAAEQALSRHERVIYTAPIKALVSEKFFALVELFGAENVGMMTGDSAVNAGACCSFFSRWTGL